MELKLELLEYQETAIKSVVNVFDGNNRNTFDNACTDGDKETLICIDVIIADETVGYFKTHTDQKLIVLERALDTTKKWNLKHAMGDKFNAF
ncbi:MAG: hypothetical protein GY834_05965 [Bacteroidetes bacterium]|nr:hypothetical protein [Bacteroidota bacterium]